MLTIYRSNRAELLAQLLATKLRLEPPPPLAQARVVVNTWPTSRWLGEQLALGLGEEDDGGYAGGVVANVRFPFPGSHLRQLVDALLAEPSPDGTAPDGATARPGEGDPWRAQQLVWPVLERLPALVERPEAALLKRWLDARGEGGPGPAGAGQLDRPLWQLGRAIADAFDDYTLYRPAMVLAWLQGEGVDGRGAPLPQLQLWQPLLMAELAAQLPMAPFGLRVGEAIERLRQGPGALPPGWDGEVLRLFGLSSMAPTQVALLQALSGVMEVELYLLTPCRDLWQRLGARGDSLAPLGEDWLLRAPGLEARFGRLGAEFQQLLEGSGDTQLGAWNEGDLFFSPASAARRGGAAHPPRRSTLLERLQQRLAAPERSRPLLRAVGDTSLEFHACPGRLRQLQIVRDRLLQLMAADPTLQPRDILVMTPQVDGFAPLVGAVFGDSEATGVPLPWRLTDRSQQGEAGISQALLGLLALGGDRLTASALEALLGCPPLLSRHQISVDEAGAITDLLQRAGFRWGLNALDRGGDPSHSLGWAIDRLLLGLVLPEEPGLAPGAVAPMAMAGSVEQQCRWLHLLVSLRRTLEQLGHARPPARWIPLLRQLLGELFGDGGERAWELQAILAALADWQAVAGASGLRLEAPVVADVLAERLGADSGRFGHRSGALTISALEPMRAIPHRVIVLMGLDAGVFPRQRERPGFHLMEQGRQLGDPNPGDQDRYVLLESLISARQHLLITWSNREERTGETLQPSTPVRQWMDLLRQEMSRHSPGGLPLREHSPNPLARSNFLADPPWPPASSDLRYFQARRHLEGQDSTPPSLALALGEPPPLPPPPSGDGALEDLRHWITAPQESWLRGLGLRPREWGRCVDDLEALSLEELQRAELLREGLASTVDTPTGEGPQEAPDWLWLQRGTGRLPPLAAGVLEAEQLRQRWDSLQLCLTGLGEERRQPVICDDLSGQLRWHGDALVVCATAQVRSRHRLELWLDLLLATAAGQAPRQGVLIGRDKQRFAVVARLVPPTLTEAQDHLEQLRAWRQEGRTQCWPVPPETGWAFVEAEQKRAGSGLGKATSVWEGGYHRSGERESEVMAVCFGAGLATRELLTTTALERAQALFSPLLESQGERTP